MIEKIDKKLLTKINLFSIAFLAIFKQIFYIHKKVTTNNKGGSRLFPPVALNRENMKINRQKRRELWVFREYLDTVNCKGKNLKDSLWKSVPHFPWNSPKIKHKRQESVFGNKKWCLCDISAAPQLKIITLNTPPIQMFQFPSCMCEPSGMWRISPKGRAAEQRGIRNGT